MRCGRQKTATSAMLFRHDFRKSGGARLKCSKPQEIGTRARALICLSGCADTRGLPARSCGLSPSCGAVHPLFRLPAMKEALEKLIRDAAEVGLSAAMLGLEIGTRLLRSNLVVGLRVEPEAPHGPTALPHKHSGTVHPLPPLMRTGRRKRRSSAAAVRPRICVRHPSRQWCAT